MKFLTLVIFVLFSGSVAFAHCGSCSTDKSKTEEHSHSKGKKKKKCKGDCEKGHKEHKHTDGHKEKHHIH